MSIPIFALPEDSVPSDFSVTVAPNGSSIHLNIGTTTGALIQADYKPDQLSWSCSSEKRLFKKPVRNIEQSENFTFITSSSGKIAVYKDGQEFIKAKSLKDEEGAALDISSLCCLNSVEELSDPNVDMLISVGDEYGNVYIFKLHRNLNTWEQVFVAQEQDDSITDLIYHSYKKTLIASSGDGSFVVIDTKKLKLVAHSSSLEDEILSMAMDNHNNVICSTGLGALVLYKWGYWGKVASRLKPKYHSSSSINCMQTVNDSDISLITGTHDGTVRKIELGADFAVKQTLNVYDDSVEIIKTIRFDSSDYAVVSLTNDNRIFFINLVALVSDEPKSDDADKCFTKPKKAKMTQTRGPTGDQLGSFFQGLD